MKIRSSKFARALGSATTAKALKGLGGLSKKSVSWKLLNVIAQRGCLILQRIL